MSGLVNSVQPGGGAALHVLLHGSVKERVAILSATILGAGVVYGGLTLGAVALSFPVVVGFTALGGLVGLYQSSMKILLCKNFH